MSYYDLSKVIDLKNIDLDKLFERADINKDEASKGGDVDLATFFKSDNKGDSSALFLAALVFQQGYGHVLKDENGEKIETINWAKSYACAEYGAKLGHPLCIALLAAYCDLGIGRPVDIQMANTYATQVQPELEKQAKLGRPYALTYLATLYGYGLGTLPAQPIAVAVDYFRQAAAQGEPEALCSLAYFAGGADGHAKQKEVNRIIKKDPHQALDLLKPALAMEQANAEYLAGKTNFRLLGNAVEARDRLEKGAEQGHAHAQHLLGYWYEGEKVNKLKGSVADPSLAFKWHEKAGSKGYTESTLFTAACYADGKGVEKDPVRAIILFLEAMAHHNEGLSVVRKLTEKERLVSQAKLGALMNLPKIIRTSDDPVGPDDAPLDDNTIELSFRDFDGALHLAKDSKEYIMRFIKLPKRPGASPPGQGAKKRPGNGDGS
jgi:TPR repeat protein